MKRQRQSGTRARGGAILVRRSFPTWAPDFPRIPSIPDPYSLVGRMTPGSRRSAIIALASALCLLALHLHIFASKGLLDRNKVRELITARQEAIDATARENQKLKAEIAMLQNDTGAIEAIARNEYSMAKPGESIYRVQRESVPKYVLNIPAGKSSH